MGKTIATGCVGLAKELLESKVLQEIELITEVHKKVLSFELSLTDIKEIVDSDAATVKRYCEVDDPSWAATNLIDIDWLKEFVKETPSMIEQNTVKQCNLDTQVQAHLDQLNGHLEKIRMATDEDDILDLSTLPSPGSLSANFAEIEGYITRWDTVRSQLTRMRIFLFYRQVEWDNTFSAFAKLVMEYMVQCV